MSCKTYFNLKWLDKDAFPDFYDWLQESNEPTKVFCKLCRKELLDGNTGRTTSIEMQKVFELENDLKTVNKHCYSEYYEMKPSITLNLHSFYSSKQFLLEIYQKICKGKKVVYLHCLEDKLLYGKLSFQENLLLIHAVSSEPILQGVERVKLVDLKRAWEEVDTRAFLKISDVNLLEYLVIIKMRDLSLTPQFVRLCTGEDGPCYKGSSFEKDNHQILKLDSYMNCAKYNYGSFDYFSTFNVPKTKFKANDFSSLVLEGKSDGSFQICETESPYYSLGIIEAPSNLKEIVSYAKANNFTLIDSGFLFKL